MFQRPENNHLSLQQKASIDALHHQNIPKNEIAFHMDCHITTIRKWIRRHETTQDVHRQGGSRRK